ncbi:MAG: Trp family transcriptional regulator, partial [Proteobacteria bacterium]|nr:Trp family transcriptional regulator [Pseudomonadota bacterium]
MKNLNEALLMLKNKNEVDGFLKDLCTPAELKALEERWSVA